MPLLENSLNDVPCLFVTQQTTKLSEDKITLNQSNKIPFKIWSNVIKINKKYQKTWFSRTARAWFVLQCLIRTFILAYKNIKRLMEALHVTERVQLSVNVFNRISAKTYRNWQTLVFKSLLGVKVHHLPPWQKAITLVQVNFLETRHLCTL